MLYDPLAAPSSPPGGRREPYTFAPGAGAIAAKRGVVFITAGAATALTLDAPVPGDDDGSTLAIVSATAFAHTVTQAAPGFNGAGVGQDVATFGAAAGNGLSLVAYGGAWYVTGNVGVTLA